MNKNALFGALLGGPSISDLSLDDVRPDPAQPRKFFNAEALQELANSIDQHGLVQPIVVRRDPADGKKYLITAGERRYRAMVLLNRKTIEAIIRDDGNASAIAIIENLQRVDLSPMEEAEAVGRLILEQKLTQEGASKLLGRSRININQLLSVNGLPEVIRTEATEAGVSKSILIELAKLGDAELQTSLWQRVREGRLTVPEIRQAKRNNDVRKKQKDVRRPTSSIQKVLGKLDMVVSALEGRAMGEKDRIRLKDTIHRLSAITAMTLHQKED